MCLPPPPTNNNKDAVTEEEEETLQLNCSERFGNVVDTQLSGAFAKIGTTVGGKPRLIIVLSIALTVLCGVGFVTWETENRGEELWVPQNTRAEKEEDQYLQHFAETSRFNQFIVSSDDDTAKNVLTKETLVEVMQLHQSIAAFSVTVEDEEGDFRLLDLCTRGGGVTCANPSANPTTCPCFVRSILRVWNYHLETLLNDTDIMGTLNTYGSADDLRAVLGHPVFDTTNNNETVLVSAQALTVSYFLESRSVVEDGTETDPVNEAWEEEYLNILEDAPLSTVDYFATRSFGDEFGATITGDLTLVQISYVVAFVFLGASLGKVKCGVGSRWTLALAALFLVGLSTAAGFGVSSLFGLFYGPVHSLLPFVLLGIGVDDAFVIVNAFDRERNVARKEEDNAGLLERTKRALARSGASITVTSLTDLAAFAISSSSALPALASFCAFAAICIFFLWFFAATFFTACLVLDERRQRDNRRECVCCLTRGQEPPEEETYQEGFVSRYFRNYHAPAILSNPGKAIVLLVFAALLGFGIFGALNLSVEDSGRSFIPDDSYITDWLESSDEYFPSSSSIGGDLFVIFQNQDDIYKYRDELKTLADRVEGLDTKPPYIAPPVSEQAYRNVITSFAEYLETSGTSAIGGATLDDDNWPAQEDFASTLQSYASFSGPGAAFAQDVSYTNNTLDAIRVKFQYVKLTKKSRGRLIDDADKLIDAMDTTRDMLEDWVDVPSRFPYSSSFLTIEGFKIIRRELFQNVGLAILAVGIIVFCTVASPVTAVLITLNVAFCIIEILGFMYAVGIVIDSVSVINIVLAVGLSVDYSAHVGHCFMVKAGSDKNKRATEALADIGAAVLSGATSTFLAVVVLLFSSSYVFEILSKQFALTVGLGLLHGLVALPVFLSICGPKPFASAEKEADLASPQKELELANEDVIENEKSSTLEREETMDVTKHSSNKAPVVTKVSSDGDEVSA